MKPETVKIDLQDVTPTPTMILVGQGIPEDKNLDDRTAGLADVALSAFCSLATPVGLVADVTRDSFLQIYDGEGRNANQTPVAKIIHPASTFTLFAVTVGDAISKEISRLFDSNEFAEGAMLDSAASAGADLAAEIVERHCESNLHSSSRIDDSAEVMRFSPGYCGWHVSGQRKLFAALKPDQIGITLTGSCLMHPLKSVSGVIMSGPLGLFDIDDTYAFCADCKTHSCRDRFEAMKNKSLSDKIGKK
jgi:hypothetical protein